MTGQHKEIEFERELSEHLAANDWFYSENDDLYDVERALVPEDVFAWLQETQTAAFEKFVQPGSRDEDKRRRMLLDRLVASLDKPMTDREGALRTLRKGFNVAGLGAGSAKFDMMQARPETSLNPATMARYKANRLRVMRQVHYGDGNKSIDLVFLLNGIPVATAEVKTENTQTVENAKAQYKARLLGAKGKKPYALLGNGTRALVHFAVSEDEVWMTTKLDGPEYLVPTVQPRDRGRRCRQRAKPEWAADRVLLGAGAAARCLARDSVALHLDLRVPHQGRDWTAAAFVHADLPSLPPAGRRAEA